MSEHEHILYGEAQQSDHLALEAAVAALLPEQIRADLETTAREDYLSFFTCAVKVLDEWIWDWAPYAPVDRRALAFSNGAIQLQWFDQDGDRRTGSEISAARLIEQLLADPEALKRYQELRRG